MVTALSSWGLTETYNSNVAYFVNLENPKGEKISYKDSFVTVDFLA